MKQKYWTFLLLVSVVPYLAAAQSGGEKKEDKEEKERGSKSSSRDESEGTSSKSDGKGQESSIPSVSFICEDSVSDVLPGGEVVKGAKTIFFKCSSSKDSPVQVKSELDTTGMPSCLSSSETDKFCVEQVSNPGYVSVNGTKKTYVNAAVVLKAIGTDKVTVPANAFSLRLTHDSKTTTHANDELVLQQEIVAPKCSIIVSGAERGEIVEASRCSGKGCNPTQSQIVENGELIFRITSSNGAAFKSIKWEGGPDESGIWSAPEANVDKIVRAKVTYSEGDAPVECAVKIYQLAKAYNININRYGNCPLFRDVRNYYFLNKTNSAVQSTNYGAPLKLSGLNVDYAKDGPEIPVSGVLNGASAINGDIFKNTEGMVVIPKLDSREYSSAVIVLRKYSKVGDTYKVEEPSYYGLLNYSDYSNTRLRPIGNPSLSEDDLVVLQLFLAHKQVNKDGIDIRGSEGGIPWHEFTASQDNKPFDRLIPMAEDSCIDLFQVRLPRRPDRKKFPRSISDAKMCLLSRPFTFGDVKIGRANIKAMDTMPMYSSHLYPLDLIVGNSGAPVSEDVVTGDGSACDPASKDLVECWNISPADMAATSQPTWVSGSPITETKLSRSKVLRERDPGDECSTRVKTVNEFAKESSGPSMGVRWSTTAMSFGAAFACAVNHNIAGVPVGTNLQTSTAFDGSFSGPPATSADCPKTYQAVACCSKNTGVWDAIRGFGLEFPNSHTFTKSMAPRSCVKRTSFRVQPWGHEGGEAVASFSAFLCPGSQYSYSNVALSWSPLVLDIGGNGIQISRTFERSVRFDIKGKGVASQVDWPINVKEAAFLVLPNAEGKVTSIKELFGESRKSANGFETLRKHDSDKNKVIDARDKVFGKLRLWFDLNRNGIQEEGELDELEKHGVEAIYLSYTKPGHGKTAERKTLNSVYFNKMKANYLNVEDHYFYEYVEGKRTRK